MRTYKFWAEPCSAEDNQRLTVLIDKGARYYTRLAEIENDYRQQLREEINAWQCEHAGVNELIEQHKDNPDIPIGKLIAELVNSYHRPNWMDYRKNVLNEQTFAAKKLARKASGLAPEAWGTYQRIERAHEQARSTTKWPRDLKTFCPWDVGDVAVHAQYSNPKEGKPPQTRISTSSLFNDEWLFAQISPEPYRLGRRVNRYASRATSPADRGRSGQLGRPRLRELRIRVSAEGRKPVWARLHVLLHRNMFQGDVTWVRVHRMRVGIRYRWSVQIIVDNPEMATKYELVQERKPKQTEAAAGIVGIDLRCGRRVEGGRLLAYAVGSDGAQHELVIPDMRIVQKPTRTISQGVLHEHDKVAELASIRALRFNAAVTELREFAKTLPEDHWLRAELVAAHAWKRWGRLVVLMRKWAEMRFEGDAGMFSRMTAELKQERHLYAWQAHSLTKRIRRITGRVHQWTAMLAKRYSVIAVEDIKLVKLKEQDKKDPTSVLASRIQVMAPGRCREIAAQHASIHRHRLVTVPTVDSTRECHVCSTRCEVIGDELTCPACGLISFPWVNAAFNVKARASAYVLAHPEEVQVVKKPKVRFDRKRPKEVPLDS